MGRKRFSVGKLISVSVLSMLLIFISTPAYASNSKDIFPEEEVMALLQRTRDKAEKDLESNSKSNYILGYPQTKGTILVTTDKALASFPTGHAAIVYDQSHVIEAVLTGVVKGPNDWDSSKHEYYGAVVKATTRQEDAQAANYCAAQIGKGYNAAFWDIKTRDRFYCSQLVWAAYKDKFGIDLQTEAFGNIIYPFELIETDKTNTIYHHVK